MRTWFAKSVLLLATVATFPHCGDDPGGDDPDNVLLSECQSIHPPEYCKVCDDNDPEKTCDLGNGTVGVKSFEQYYRSLVLATGTTPPIGTSVIFVAYGRASEQLPQTNHAQNMTPSAQFAAATLSGYFADQLINDDLGRTVKLVLGSVTSNNSIPAGPVLTDLALMGVVNAAAHRFFRRAALGGEVEACTEARSLVLSNLSSITSVDNRRVLLVCLTAMLSSLEMLKL